MRTYWLMTYAVQLTMHMATVTVVLLVGYVWSMEYFVRTSFVVHLVLFFMWGQACLAREGVEGDHERQEHAVCSRFQQDFGSEQKRVESCDTSGAMRPQLRGTASVRVIPYAPQASIALAWFISSIFSRTRPAMMLTNMLMILSCLAHFVLSFTAFVTDSSPEGDPMQKTVVPPPAPYYLWPPFAFMRGVYMVCRRANTVGGDLFSTDAELNTAVVFLLFDTLLYGALAARRNP